MKYEQQGTTTQSVYQIYGAFILGAECALQGKVDWKQVRFAVDLAHNPSTLGS